MAAPGRLLVREQGSPSRLVDALVRRDLVGRVPHEQDERAVLIHLTDAGRALAARPGEATSRLTGETGARLTAEDVETLTAPLPTLLDGTDAARAVRSRFPRRGASLRPRGRGRRHLPPPPGHVPLLRPRRSGPAGQAPPAIWPRPVQPSGPLGSPPLLA
ncbi:MarR family winged helix-turn-helix transcriptional regulator [Kitasatospora sp. NPDC057904]|uniref:MarR family winged helix-turn-helix transcriptional regulator n=1 Tax=unclassified Kitasatospora TaxID=2633591 RepID=UPI0036DEC31A